MGLFDFFKRKPRKVEPDVPVEELLARAAEERPHCHHYTFAHVALRQVAFDDPVACLGVLGSPDATAFLTSLWDSVDRHCREHGEVSSINPAEIVVHRLRVGNLPCAVVEMPEPWFTTGAHFVGLLLQVPVSEVRPGLKDAPLLYYTLEKGMSLDGTPRTVLCGWTKDGTHHNLGAGPAPTLAAFVETISGLQE